MTSFIMIELTLLPRFSYPEDPLTRWFLFTLLHGSTFQKTVVFVTVDPCL
jgi:hypothetical protein